ncbi:hypothetical protein ACP70R_043496 [Stipagrostis hirtigluma subsp. patula]
MQDACINLTEAAHSVQLFKINAFTATKEEPGYTSSRVWSVGGHLWQIDFQPDCRNDAQLYSDSDWIKLRVSLISRASRVAAAFSCVMVDPSSTQSPSQEVATSSTFDPRSFMDVLLPMARRDLERSGYLKDDCLLVRCALTVLLGGPTPAAVPRIAPGDAAAISPSSDLQEHFGELLRSQKAVDVTFLVSGEPVAAHRCVLAARSPVFMAELFGDMKENVSQCVEIKDMDAEVFKALLHFIYTDTSPELDHQQGEEATVMAQHLLEAADRFGVERLKAICVEKVCDGISVETVATTLALAEQHECSKLKVRCMEFILATPANLHAVAATEGYKHLEASCPSVLTDLLRLMLKGHK